MLTGSFTAVSNLNIGRFVVETLTSPGQRHELARVLTPIDS